MPKLKRSFLKKPFRERGAVFSIRARSPWEIRAGTLVLLAAFLALLFSFQAVQEKFGLLSASPQQIGRAHV